MTKFFIIEEPRQVNQLIDNCKATGYASVDFETNGKKLYTKDFIPTILTVTYQAGQSVVIPLGHENSPLRDRWLNVLKKFGSEVIENPNIVKIAWNWKFDNQIFEKYKIFSRGYVIDGMLAKYLLNEERPNDLKSMVSKYLPEYSGYEAADKFDKIPWDLKPFIPLCMYGSIDTDMTFRLGIFFEHKIRTCGFIKLYRNLIMPASQVLQKAEANGLEFDTKYNLELIDKYRNLIDSTKEKLFNLKKVRRYDKIRIEEKKQRYIDDLELEIANLVNVKLLTNQSKQVSSRENKIINITAGNYTTKKEQELFAPINFGSTKQLVDFLYIHPKGLQLPILEYTKDKQKKPTTNPSTAEETLLKLKEYDKYGFLSTLLELRGYEHSNSTFIVGYRDLLQDDGRLHPTFNIHGTVTGRLSSKNPNAQQIPKKEVNADIKKQFICPPGQLMLSYDYSQAELRVMAHLSGDETLLEAFRLGRDPHLSIACKKYDKKYEDILPIYLDETNPGYKEWKVKRKQAKQIVFGCIYGVEAKKLATQLSDIKTGLVVTKDEAQKFLDEFFNDSPKVKKFILSQGKKMERQGFVKTLFGRKRRCPNIYSDNMGLYLEAKRQSVNAPCQSVGSDMALFASILMYQEMKKGNLPFIPEISTVHDSVYNYCNPDFINPWTIYQFYLICKNPDTKKYFDFQINDVDMAMDFSVGITMIDEYPYTPGYDYNEMLKPTFNIDEYYKLHNERKGISIADYPKEFPEYFTKEYIKEFQKFWRDTYNNQ